jgi:electron transport complex protein RnfE
MKLQQEFLKGLWRENPVLVLVLGMCPTLAVSTSVRNGLGMGLATTFVLVGSNLVVSLVRKLIPKKVRIPCYIVIIATFVTLVDMVTAAYFQPIHKALGIFIPLIVVNCIVLGRAEAFASKRGVVASLADGLGMGAGFTLTLIALGAVREFLAGGVLLDIQITPEWTHGFLIMKFAPGAFVVLGLFLAGMNWISMRRAARQGQAYAPPKELNCAHCRMCDLSTAGDGQERVRNG